MKIPWHALRGKVLHRQISHGTLVGSQGQRALVVPMSNGGETVDALDMNWLANADFVPLSVEIDFCIYLNYKCRP